MLADALPNPAHCPIVCTSRSTKAGVKSDQVPYGLQTIARSKLLRFCVLWPYNTHWLVREKVLISTLLLCTSTASERRTPHCRCCCSATSYRTPNCRFFLFCSLRKNTKFQVVLVCMCSSRTVTGPQHSYRHIPCIIQTSVPHRLRVLFVESLSFRNYEASFFLN